MVSSVIPRIFQLYVNLANVTDMPVEMDKPRDNSYTMELAVCLINKCDKLIWLTEKQIVPKLVDIQLQLKQFCALFARYNQFECCCEETMKIIKLQTKSQIGLQNKLPQLEKHIGLLVIEFQYLIDIITQVVQQPYDKQLVIKKRGIYSKLLKVLDSMQREYMSFGQCFQFLDSYLERKLELRVLSNLDEVQEYLDGKTNTFLTETMEEDNAFLLDTFGEISSTSEFQELVRNSLKDTIKEHGLSLDAMKKADQAVESSKRKKLQMELDDFQKCYVCLVAYFGYFQHISMPKPMTEIIESQVYVEGMKNVLDMIVSQQNRGLRR